MQGQASEWALLKRHPSEDCFGVQICGSHPDSVARCVQLIDDTIDVDFIDINMGCPIDLVRCRPTPSHWTGCEATLQYLSIAIVLSRAEQVGRADLREGRGLGAASAAKAD